MSHPVSSPASSVVDTVVLRYFLFVGKADLLVQLLGRPIMVPNAVYSTADDDGTTEALLSELMRSIRWQRSSALDLRRPRDKRALAVQLANRLETIHNLVARGDVVIEQLSAEELALFVRLTSVEHIGEFGLVAPLGTGEAACIAIAHVRSMTLVTDDNDGLRAFQSINTDAPYERIRKLLIRAANEGLITQAEANAIYNEMLQLGFYGDEPPFPS